MLYLRGGMFGGDGVLDLGRSGLQFVQQSNNYSKYNFYVDFSDGKGKDRVSGTIMHTTLEAGRVNADGSYLGEDVPAIQDGKLNTLGEIEQLILYSEDYKLTFDSAGAPVTDPVYSDPFDGMSANEINFTTGTNYVYGTFAVTPGEFYTFSQWVKLVTSENCAYAVYDVSNSAWIISQTKYVGLTSEYSRVSFSFTAPVSCTSIRIYPQRYIDTSILGKTHHFGVQLSVGSYELPYVKNMTGGPITIPHGYSDEDEGYKWPIASCPKLLTAINGTDGTDAQGTMIVEWEPQFSAADITTTQNILTANDGTDWLLSYDGANQQLTATDGTNTAVVACVPVVGTLTTIQLKYGDNSGNKMQLVCDSTEGTAVTFAGSFPYSTDLAPGWDSTVDMWQQIKSIKIQEANPWD